MAAGGRTGVEGAGSGAVGPPLLLGCQSGRGLPPGVRACPGCSSLPWVLVVVELLSRVRLLQPHGQ